MCRSRPPPLPLVLIGVINEVSLKDCGRQETMGGGWLHRERITWERIETLGESIQRTGFLKFWGTKGLISLSLSSKVVSLTIVSSRELRRFIIINRSTFLLNNINGNKILTYITKTICYTTDPLPLRLPCLPNSI